MGDNTQTPTGHPTGDKNTETRYTVGSHGSDIPYRSPRRCAPPSASQSGDSAICHAEYPDSDVGPAEHVDPAIGLAEHVDPAIGLAAAGFEGVQLKNLKDLIVRDQTLPGIFLTDF